MYFQKKFENLYRAFTKYLFHAREFRISFLGSPPEKKNIAISKRLSLYTLISLPVNLELLKDIQRVKKRHICTDKFRIDI